MRNYLTDTPRRMAGETSTPRRKRRRRNSSSYSAPLSTNGFGTASVYFYLLALLVLPTLLFIPVSAKIRVPNSFASRESKQDNRATAAKTSSTNTAKETSTTSPPIETDDGGEPNSLNQDNGSFQNWFSNNWSEMVQLEQSLTDTLSGTGDSSAAQFAQAPADDREAQKRIYGIRLSSLSFASVTSQEYLSRLEDRLQTARTFLEQAQGFVTSGLVVLWKTTNDVVRYKFPVGIVSAWSAVAVFRKILGHRKRRQKTTKDRDQNQRDETPDTYKYILRHTGRALDLDTDDLTSYRHLGGIEQVRSRLLRSAVSELIRRRRTSSKENDESDELLEALLAALSMEFIPGGSHSEYIRNLIPFFSKAEDCAQKLGMLLPKNPPLAHHQGGGSKSSHPHGYPVVENSQRLPFYPKGDEEHPDAPVFTDEDETKLVSMALQTAEVRILDSQLRSIRDRLIRTTYRLDRTVKYWKSKIESERLSASLLASNTAGSWNRLALLYSSPLQRLKLRWSRLFLFGNTAASSSVLHKNPNFVHNSLLEGDRLRLAFAEAAFHAEIVRLGKVLDLLGRRPEEMPDSALTHALVEQQNERHQQQQQQLEQQQPLWNGDEAEGENTDTANNTGNKRSQFFQRVRRMAAGTKDRIAKTIDRHRNRNNPVVDEKQETASLLIQPFQTASQTLKRLWAQRRQRRKSRRNKFFTIRFNADGRGKFSVQTYDEGRLTIESDTAKRLLLSNYKECQKPWLDQSNAWALEARGLIVDTIRETVEASINPSSGNSNGRSGGYTTANGETAATNQLDDLESTWRVRKYMDPSAESSDDDASTESPSPLIPALLSSKLVSASPSPTTSIPLRQWMVLYEMSRDINRLKRVGEGKSLKFKWREVHWIHWLTQWNLVGLPSAALKIWAAMWIHKRSKPYVPRVQEVSREAYAATLEILTTRFWTPVKDLFEELTSRKQTLVTGVSLGEEEASLDIMLKDLGLGDGTPATRHEATIQATRQYESCMKSGLMLHALGGKLARLMLIQVQQLKVSMLDAAETIDVLFQSNKINMQLLAIIPAIGIVFVGAKIFVRFLFSVRAKDLRPITSVHAEMTDYLNELESNIILRMGGRTTKDAHGTNGAQATTPIVRDQDAQEKQQLGEFALTLYNYLLLLDYSSPQPFSSRQCDVIHRSLTTFLGKNGSFCSDRVSVEGQSRLLDNIQGKHQELAKFL